MIYFIKYDHRSISLDNTKDPSKLLFLSTPTDTLINSFPCSLVIDNVHDSDLDCLNQSKLNVLSNHLK
ncbi:MAG: hypothetical protein WCG25_02580 [bacterium]